jgi:hypothetical protein
MEAQAGNVLHIVGFLADSEGYESVRVRAALHHFLSGTSSG